MTSRSSERRLIATIMVIAFLAAGVFELVSPLAPGDELLGRLHGVYRIAMFAFASGVFLAGGIVTVRNIGLGLRSIAPIVLGVGVCGLFIWGAVRKDQVAAMFARSIAPLPIFPYRSE